jgi:hypothetical protein
MKLRKLFGAGILLCMMNLCIAAIAANPRSCPASASDAPQIVDVVKTMFVAAAKDDLTLFHSVTTSDFYAYDGGKRFDGDALMNLIKSAHDAGNVYVWSVNDPVVHVDCETAWISYVNKGSVQNDKGIMPIIWLESVVLEKKDGQWRAHFVHSTRQQQP